MFKLIKKFLNERRYHRRYIRSRERYARKDLLVKLESNPITSIDNFQKRKIKNFWKRYPVQFNFGWFDFYNTIAPDADHLEYYIPHDLFYCSIDSYFSNIELASAFDNKNMYDLYFHDILQPKTVVRIMNGMLLDGDYRIISVEEAIQCCQNEKLLIIKPSVNSEGGSRIRFWSMGVDSVDELKRLLTQGENYVVQSVVEQCATLAEIHSSSLNTIRIITLIRKNEVMILSSVLRMGVGGAKIDNAASGGIFCGIMNDGSLKKYAYDSTGRIHLKHPQGGDLSRYRIPNFELCKELVRNIAPRLGHISKLCSWDLCLDKENRPLLIEVNLSYGDVQLHQLTNGPIFGKHTPEILDEIFIGA